MNQVLSAKPTGKKVMLMATCLCDAFYSDVAKATVEVLEHLGCEVTFPEGQTCCGQPAFNSGDFETGRKVARHTMKTFSGTQPIIVPSGSCAAMNQHGNSLQFESEEDRAAAADMGRRTWELCDFLTDGLGIDSWSGTIQSTRVALHHSCHTRGSGTRDAAMALLSGIEGLEIVEFGEDDQCCGFGGTFSVTFPHLSGEIGSLKLDHVLESRPDKLVSVDMSCLMHLSGLGKRQGRDIPIAHLSQVLRDAIQEGKNE